jgi:hypothetical protein
MLGVAPAGLAEDPGATRAGSSKLMKLKFAESFLSTEITEMPIDPGEDFTLLRERYDEERKRMGRGRRGN